MYMQFYDKKFTLHKAYPKSAYPPQIFTPRAKCKLNLYNLKSMMSLITSFFPLIVLTLFQNASYPIYLFKKSIVFFLLVHWILCLIS
jgi:hypothetical protein